MMHFISILRAYGLGLVGAAWLLALAPVWAAPTPPPAQNGQPFDRAKPWSWGLEGDKVWLGYYGQDHGFYLKPPEGREQRLNPPGGAVSSGLVFETAGKEVYALWRDKDTSKRLLFARSTDGGQTYAAPVVLDQDSDPLTRLKLKARGSEIALLWLGEKGSYDLYFKYSADRGQTFTETQKVLPGIYPAWIVSDQAIYVFSRTPLDGKDYFVVRRFDPKTKTFGETLKIKEAPPIPPFFEAFQSGNRLFLTWVGQYGELLNELRLEGAYSDDQGRTWKDFSLKGPTGIDFTKIQFCQGGGHVYAAYSASRRFAVSSSKENVYLVKSADNGATWSEPRELRHEALPNTRARYPSLVCDDQGKVVVAWEDWRLIRPRIFLNYSKDFGATWSLRDYPLEPVASRDNLILDPLVPGLKEVESAGTAKGKPGQGSRYYLMAQRYKNDGLLDRDFVLYTLSPDFFKKSPTPLRTLGPGNLKDRVNGYWKALEKEDYTAAYEFIDPFFRARHLREEYVIKRRPMKYHAHQIKDIKIEGNVAQVDTAIEYSIPKLTVGVKEFSRDKTQAGFSDTWIYVDNQWYQSYQETESGYRYAQY